jgi:hypothetical protein
MAKPKSVYPELESKILIVMYENPETEFDTFLLTQRLYEINVGSPEFPDRFHKTVKSTEQLIVKGLVDGKQLKHHSLGLYFSEMKFKFKGKQEAIRVRDESEDFKGQLPELAKHADAVAKEMAEAEEKRKK